MNSITVKKPAVINYLLTVEVAEGKTHVGLAALGKAIAMPAGNKVRTAGTADEEPAAAISLAFGAVIVDLVQQGVLESSQESEDETIEPTPV